MLDLPTGTLTFLFTDIEGSTRLWERYPEAMRVAHARHSDLIAECVRQHHGALVRSRGEGDSTFSVFTEATDALAAVCALQRALHTEPWPPETPLRVRAALHTGTAELAYGDYNSSAVNRCARLRAIAHGGQTLLSQTTFTLVQDRLPEGVRLKEMGLHRLKDLQRPERVYQMLHPDLPADFPPLKSLDCLPTNLPVQLTSFIGREQEMAEVKRLLSATRLLTLTGTGGCGKTRLALQVGAEVLERFQDGVWLVELASLSDPSLVAQAAVSALGLREEPGRPLMQTLTDALQSRSLLLILDNCEHLVLECARLAETLLRRCPRLTILATSREALNVVGELAWRVSSLPVPPAEDMPSEEKDLVAALTEWDAVRLFVERALFTRPDFRPTRQNARVIAQICRRLDGIPLAIELAAARVRALSVEQIAARLDDRFRLLTGGGRTALPRQQTLRALIDWSYDLLSEEERALLRRLSVFAGGFTLEAAEAIFDLSTGQAIENQKSEIVNSDILDLLSRLVDKSLVLMEERDEGARYRLLETVRQYARERLREAGEAERVRGRHRDYFLALAEEAEPHLIGPAQAVWLERLETEHDNLRAALDFGLSDQIENQKSEIENAEAGLRLAGALARFWYAHGHVTEGRQWLERVLAHPQAQEGTLGWARTLLGSGILASCQSDYPAARSFLDRCLAITRPLGLQRETAWALNGLGLTAWYQGDYAASQRYYEESLAIWQELEDRSGTAIALMNLGLVLMDQGDYAASQGLFEESLALFRQNGDQRGGALALANLGVVAQQQGDFALARTRYEESLAVQRMLGDRRNMALLLMGLGFLSCHLGDFTLSRNYLKESLAESRELGEMQAIAYVLENFAYLAAEEGQVRRAADPGKWTERTARLLGAASTLREAIHAPLPPRDREDYDRTISAVKSHVGEEAYAAAWEEGRAMSLEQALAFALEEDRP